ncbi:hypothetical protein [Modicisalibacter luteus]|uniref:Uncharacterized protein n=1 Tax=Modicisalibacter luteus TaxID=453962 RepID=A0ABV7LVZ7_9GAMM|nr:hypothetical protein [Halomonas lutea]GHB14327.1 hypothetical protein GCM10007159_40900 [Halomonas lutea]
MRLANAGDLGVYALKLLGGGNAPLRRSDLTDAKLNQLALLEVFAARSMALTQQQPQPTNSALAELLGIFPGGQSFDDVPSFADIAAKYDMTEEALLDAVNMEEQALSKRRHSINEAHHPAVPLAPVGYLH